MSKSQARYEAASEVREISGKMIELLNQFVAVTKPYNDEIGYSVEVVRTNILDMLGAEGYYNSMGNMDSIVDNLRDDELFEDIEDDEDEHMSSTYPVKHSHKDARGNFKSKEAEIKANLVLSASDMRIIQKGLGEVGFLKLNALKAYREATGASLLVSKCAVELFQDMPIHTCAEPTGKVTS